MQQALASALARGEITSRVAAAGGAVMPGGGGGVATGAAGTAAAAAGRSTIAAELIDSGVAQDERRGALAWSARGSLLREGVG